LNLLFTELWLLITKILVAFDNTECANKALDFALDMAEKFGAQVHVLNVMEIPVFSSPDDPLAFSPGMVGVVKDLRKAHLEILAKAAKKAASLKPDVLVSTELREGKASAEIVAAAGRGGFDVVVLGHREKVGFGSCF
jgi:nucleotide-binding universal stress UspA family protein